jgi:large subunit ribosomal protein L15
MVRRFKKKVRKQRGSLHHGYGIQKGHKKAGSRGGVGKAGGQRHEWIRSIKQGRKYGKHGFTRPPRAKKPHQAMNIGEITTKIDQLLADGYARKEGRQIIVDAAKMGITKILGRGEAKKMTIIVDSASASAKEKLEKAGGQLESPK